MRPEKGADLQGVVEVLRRAGHLLLLLRESHHHRLQAVPRVRDRVPQVLDLREVRERSRCWSLFRVV